MSTAKQQEQSGDNVASGHVELAGRQAAGLRALADLIEAHPGLAVHMRYSLDRVLVCVTVAEDQKGALAAFLRAAPKRSRKNFEDGKWAAVDVDLGAVKLHVYADRDQVCERVVVGTREVTEEVPDPEALAAVPTMTQTRTEEIVEWQCRPLLADTTTVAAPIPA